MIIVITATAGGEPAVSLAEADDCQAFHLEARAVDAADVATALARAGAGSVAGDDAFIEPTAVRSMAAGAAVGPDWEDRFQGMLAYAEKKGWLDENGAVQAHIEWS